MDKIISCLTSVLGLDRAKITTWEKSAVGPTYRISQCLRIRFSWSVLQADKFHSQEKCQNTKKSLYQHEITPEKCSESHLQSYRNQADVLNFLSQQSEYWPIRCVEIINCRSKDWPGLVLYAQIIRDWITHNACILKSHGALEIDH